MVGHDNLLLSPVLLLRYVCMYICIDICICICICIFICTCICICICICAYAFIYCHIMIFVIIQLKHILSMFVCFCSFHICLCFCVILIALVRSFSHHFFCWMYYFVTPHTSSCLSACLVQRRMVKLRRFPAILILGGPHFNVFWLKTQVTTVNTPFCNFFPGYVRMISNFDCNHHVFG